MKHYADEGGVVTVETCAFGPSDEDMSFAVVRDIVTELVLGRAEDADTPGPLAVDRSGATGESCVLACLRRLLIGIGFRVMLRTYNGHEVEVVFDSLCVPRAHVSRFGEEVAAYALRTPSLRDLVPCVPQQGCLRAIESWVIPVRGFPVSIA